jgi:hypothetical protein
MRRLATAMSAIGVAAALALWAWLRADDGVVQVAADGKAIAASDLRSAGSSASLETPTPATATAGPPQPISVSPAATAVFAVPITVSIPQKLLVGEMHDLIIGVGSNAGVGEIGFTVQFDANVLQARAASQGGWAVDVDVNPRFAAEISGAEDRVQIRSAVSGQRVGGSGGSVAVVQFQPVAPGTTSVLIADVVVRDGNGRPMTPALSASNLQVTVESGTTP